MACASASGCDREVYAKGYCSAHYERRRRGGSADDPIRYKPQPGDRFHDLTLVEDRGGGTWLMRCECGKEVVRQRGSTIAQGVKNCSDWTRHRDPRLVDDPGYNGVHKRLQYRGPRASTLACVDCQGPAKHWSYDHTDPEELVDERGFAYSLDLNRYEPRCIACHKRYDLNIDKEAS